MLSQEQNDRLTRTDPGTPLGRLFRSYWIPALLSEELPEPDCPPVRVKLLSERLIAFRDTNGRLGLMDEFCAHRGVSLWFAPTEECGLRCPYHGWKYDVTGQCIDVPSEPEESGFSKKIKLKSYPLIERGGVLWTFMGPADKLPPLPEWEFATVPAKQSFMTRTKRFLLDRNPIGRKLLTRFTTAQIKAETKGNYPAPPAAFKVVLAALTQPKEKAFVFESESFARLAVTPESRNLVGVHRATADGAPAKQRQDHSIGHGGGTRAHRPRPA